MSLFPTTEVCVFSPLEGVLTYKGEPAAGAKIVRVVKWKDDKGETDTYYADAQGRFSLPEMRRSWPRTGLAQFVTHQSLYVHYEGQEFHIWEMGHGSKERFGEFGGPLEGVVCEITGDLEPAPTSTGILGTSCRWKGFEK